MKEVVRGTIDTTLVADMTVREVERIDYKVVSAGGSAKAGIDQKLAIAAMYVWKGIMNYRYTEKGEKMPVSMLLKVAQDARVRFIQQHIINYITFSVLTDYYDWLVEKRYITKSAEGYWRKVERCFSSYQRYQRSFMKASTWAMFLDHMRLSTDNVQAYVEKLEFSVRDYLIQHRHDISADGQRDDIPLLQKSAVCFLFLTAMQHSFRDFFSDIVKIHGVDFTYEFRYAWLGKMTQNMIWMCEALGVKFGIDKDGDTVLAGVNIGDSVRVNGAWNALTAVLGDSRLLDETAAQAISLNPEEKKVFDEKLAMEKRKEEAENQRLLEQGIEQLKEKYNNKKIN